MNFWRDPIQITRWGTPADDYGSAPPALRALAASFDMQDPFDEGLFGGERHYEEPSIFWSIAAPLGTSAPCLKTLALTQFDPLIVSGDGNGDDFDDDEGNSCAHPFALFSRVFNRLSHLDMRLSDLDGNGTEGSVASATASILRRAPRLPSLKLHIQESLWCKLSASDYWGGTIQSPLDDGIPVIEFLLMQGGRSAGFPHLKCLELKSVICDGNALAVFLWKEVPNLQSLTLKDCMFFARGDLEPPDQRQCWIDTLKMLRRSLRLTTVDFGGFVTNRGRQHWHITEDASLSHPDSVKARMIKWFLDKTAVENACPLNVFELGEGELDTSKDDDVLRAATDESWSMTCPLDAKYPNR